MMNVKKMKVANFKYYIVLALCAVVITLSIISIIKRPKETSSVTQRQGPFDPELYYNKEMPNFERDGKEREINFPTNKNILILGVNREVAETIQRYDRLFEKLDFSAYDVEIIILTNREEHRESKYVKTYYYNNAEFDRYFKIGEESKFVLLVNKENRIKHYMDRMIALHNIRLLIERFRSKERNES
jgi:hypothetical protein